MGDCGGKGCYTLIKILAIICGLCMMGLAVYKFIYTKNMEILRGIWTFYWLVFGLLIECAELNVTFVLNLFGFLKGFCGKGMFIIFCGTLLIDSFESSTIHETILGRVLNIPIYNIGIVIIVIGVFTILVGSQQPPENAQQPQYAQPGQAYQYPPQQA